MKLIVALALAFGACGGKTKCEKLVDRSNECDASRGGMRMTADMVCTDDRHADYIAKIAACADEPDCDAFHACLVRLTPGLHE